jgi:DNA end-binding protein Ku
MPRASWRGFLRLSLVSCPIYLSPATSRTKPIRLHQVWRPAPAEEQEDTPPDRGRDEQLDEAPALRRDGADQEREEQFNDQPLSRQDRGSGDADLTGGATRITLRPHDPTTGEEIEKSDVVKGYEYSRGQFVTFTAEELKVLDVESSKVIDLETFVPRSDIDPVYFDSPYYLYPDGSIAVETLRVIGAAMAELGLAGLGRLTLTRRERMVMVEPRGTGMALFTLRAADEVRTPQFGSAEGDLDFEMVAIAAAIIRQRTGKFDPSTFRDRYQDALRELIEAKMKGLTIKPRVMSTPPPVIDLMAALKRSLARETPAVNRAATKSRSTKATPDRRQTGLLLPVSGGRQRQTEPAAESSGRASRRRKA